MPDGPPPHPEPRVPALVLPPGACDSHCHIYGPFARFPLPPDRSFTPNEAPETALRRLHDHLGISRAVIVQCQGHGFDHRPLLAALAAGGGRYRGVALIRAATSDGEIAGFAAAGVCGARFSFMAHLGAGPDPELVRTVVARVREHGWHTAIHVAGAGAGGARGTDPVDRSTGRDRSHGPSGYRGGGGWAGDGGAAAAARHGPGLGEVERGGPCFRTGRRLRMRPAYAALIARHAPERVLWGSDWPHVNLQGPMPDDRRPC